LSQRIGQRRSQAKWQEEGKQKKWTFFLFVQKNGDRCKKEKIRNSNPSSIALDPRKLQRVRKERKRVGARKGRSKRKEKQRKRKGRRKEHNNKAAHLSHEPSNKLITV
jgi:hypothetical protein